jgi:RNA polymerase sigma factor (sigma-70 family)
MKTDLSRRYHNLKDVGRVITEENRIITGLYPKLQKYCYFLSQNKWDGEDLVQETMLKAINKYGFQHEFTSSLLNKIAYHQWIDQMRRKKEKVVDDLDEQPNTVINQHLEESMQTISLILNYLTPNQACIYLLKEAFLFKSREIADMMGATEMSVKSALHRAKKRLETLRKNGEESVKDLALDDEQTVLYDLFHESLVNEDPSVLIEALPALHLVNINNPASKNRHFSSYTTFSMAA